MPWASLVGKLFRWVRGAPSRFERDKYCDVAAAAGRETELRPMGRVWVRECLKLGIA